MAKEIGADLRLLLTKVMDRAMAVFNTIPQIYDEGALLRGATFFYTQ